MKSITYSELLNLRSKRKLVKDFIYFTEQGIYLAKTDSSFVLYSNNESGLNIIISETEPLNPKEGTLWVDIG